MTVVGWTVLAVVLASPSVTSDPAAEVRAAETAFAKTMADRDAAAFARYVAADAVFFGPRSVLRGREAVVNGWAPLFANPDAPFSWEPERVEVLENGELALSTGPVLGRQRERIGTFSSIWRREDDGSWRVIFDNGCPPCPCPAPAGETEGK